VFQAILFVGCFFYVGTAASQADIAAPLNSKSGTEQVVDLEVVELDSYSATKSPVDSVQVIIAKNQIIEEYRQKGELVRVKVTPTDGVPYYVDPQARNKRTGAYSDLINSGVEPVQWIIKRF